MKQKQVARIKDPKKQAAGRARAAKSLRIDGRFTSNKFLQTVTEDAQDAGAKDVFKFFEQREKLYQKVYEKMNIALTRNEDKLKHDLKHYKGRVFKNGREVKAATLQKNVSQLGSYLRNEHSVVTFYLQPLININGKLSVNMPTVAEIERRLEEGESIEEIFEEYGITLVTSSKKKTA